MCLPEKSMLKWNFLKVLLKAVGLTMCLLTVASAKMMTEDEFIWLEDIEGPKVLQWVKTENEKTMSHFQKDVRFEIFKKDALKILESEDKIPAVKVRGDLLYNFWRDKTSVRGLWRRTTLKEYKKENPKWETVLDLDELAKKEKENWVFHGVTFLAPKYERCLLSLSRGGKDAHVVREYNVVTKSFVEGGFTLPEAKSSATWVHEDLILVATDFGPGSMTHSGYTRIVKEWKRGTPLSKARQIFEAPETHMGVWVHTKTRPEKNYVFISDALTFWKSKIFLYDKGELEAVDLPGHVDIKAIFNRQVLMVLRKSWKEMAIGSVVAVDLDTGRHQLLMTPAKNMAIKSIDTSKNRVLVRVLVEVSSVIYEFRLKNKVWVSRRFDFPDKGTLSVYAEDDRDDFFVAMESFLIPDSFHLYDSKSGKLNKLKSLKASFELRSLKVDQFFSTSRDGSKIPYYMVYAKNMKLDGKNPTIIYGYGGFEIPLTPYFSDINGKLWLEKGGVYVYANIRGGGEFGPAWHQAAAREKRHKAFEDFISVAEDLIVRKVTNPKKLGIVGGSNGGLLMGAMLTMRPDLFKAIVCEVPLLDMLRYDKLLAGHSWMAEYGDLKDEKVRAFWEKYSPYHNVDKSKSYPEVFFITSTKDDRVHPGHARKMVAKMKRQGHRVYYYENSEGGHAGATNYKQVARKVALKYTYFMQKLID